MRQVILNVRVYAKQKTNLTWPKLSVLFRIHTLLDKSFRILQLY